MDNLDYDVLEVSIIVKLGDDPINKEDYSLLLTDSAIITFLEEIDNKFPINVPIDVYRGINLKDLALPTK